MNDPYAQLKRLGPERVRWLVNAGHYTQLDDETRKQQTVADKRWREAGKRLKQHRNRKR